MARHGCASEREILAEKVLDRRTDYEFGMAIRFTPIYADYYASAQVFPRHR